MAERRSWSVEEPTPVSLSATSTGRRRPGVGLDWSVEDRVCQTDVTLCRTVW